MAGAGCGAILLVFAAYCGGGAIQDSRRDATAVRANGEILEGWSCSPTSGRPFQNCPDGIRPEYLYLTFDARGSRTMAEPNAEAACRKAARRQLAGYAFAKIMAQYVESTSGVSDGESTAHAILNRGGGTIRESGIYECCSLNQRTGRCSKSNESETATWEECLCVGFMRFPGGQQAFEKLAEEVSTE